jgi:hypothetical protein
MTRERQLLVENTGINDPGSTLWHASSMMTNGKLNGGRPSGANIATSFCRILAAAFLFPFKCSDTNSSSPICIPHAAKRRESAAPIEVDTITSASLIAFAAAALQAYDANEES